MSETEFTKKVKEYKKLKSHFITPIPDIKEISYLDKPVFEAVYLNSDPKYKDIYLPDTKKKDECRLTASAKERLAITAGVIWNLQETGVDKKTPDYVSYIAVGGIRKPDGQFVYLLSSYDRDIDTLRSKLESQYTIDDDKYKYWAKAAWNKNKKRKDFELEQRQKLNRDLRQQRIYMTQLAETGAKVRCITKLLNLKSSYTQKELKNPFVAVRIVFDQNNQDPEVKAALLARRLDAEFSLYGASKKTVPQITQQPKIIEDVEVDEAEFEEEDGQDLNKKEQDKSELNLKMNPEEADFMNGDLEQQFDIVEKLALMKDYDLDSFIKRVENGIAGLSDAKKLNFYRKLNEMEDSDIPF